MLLLLLLLWWLLLLRLLNALRLASVLLNLLMFFLLSGLPFLPLHVFVFDSVYGGDAQLHLCECSQALWLRHLPIFRLEVVECVSGKAHRAGSDTDDGKKSGCCGIRSRACTLCLGYCSC